MQFDADRGGNLALGLEGGHSERRVVHAGGAATGRRITRALSALAATHERIRVLEPLAATAIASHDGRAAGLTLRPRHGDPLALSARALILATGGTAALWERTTNPRGAVGSGLSLASDAGAMLADLEFMQFHPTALRLDGPRDGFLVTEAVRGEGATLLDAHGERFVDELAPRDEVALAIETELRRSGEPAVRLDMRGVDVERFPNIAAALADVGLDPTRDLLPVAPAAHYTMGGIATDLDGRSSLPGLYAIGECACTGLHGANRLASNSLAECLVFGRRAALAATAEPAVTGAAPLRRARHARGAERGHSRGALAPRGPAPRRRRARRAARRSLSARAPDRRGVPRPRGEPRGAPAHRPPGHRPLARPDAYAGGRGRGTQLRAMAVTTDTLFREAMTHLASGVAVITARRADGGPCGIAATSLTSYSAHPPSLLVSVWHESRCHDALAGSDHFGVHLLKSDELYVAQRFADRELAPEDKFAGLEWSWDDDVPELAGTLAYLRCERADNFVRYDHTVLIGDLQGGRLEQGEPLVYARRRMDWLMQPMD